MKNIFFALLSNTKWKITQLAFFLNVTSSLFFTMWMMKLGFSEKDVIGAFCIVYSLASAPLFFKRYSFVARKFLYLSSASLLTVVTLFPDYVIFPLSAFIAAIQIARDLLIAEVSDVYARVSDSLTIDIRKIIATTVAVGGGVMCVASPMVGYLSSISPNLYFVALSALGCVVAGSLGNNETSFCLPSRVTFDFHMFCVISMGGSVCRYFIRFFMLPSVVLLFGQKIGLEGWGFALMGGVGAFLGVVGFVRFKTDKTGRISYYVPLFSVLFLSLFISSVVMYERYSSFLTVAAIISYILFEVASKFWLVNQATRLKEYAYSGVNDKTSVYSTFSKYRIAGGVVGFASAFLLYGIVDVEIGVIVSIFSIVFCTFAIVIKKAKNVIY
ncbi:hypothetical protein [Photobacterium kishitanii]|uniref:Uncharacterized protein n=1 Tax=Photobacterium kishitanii TaxID=318456 RepID=A0A2T3KM16_9GAMM|nr:hypothetical protein [Photobacterium kishitanii]PSV00719.1 hypothetical protein C9J27_06140 [Photobacterium kishitanii]